MQYNKFMSMEDFNSKNNYGNTTISLAANCQDDTKIVEMLFRRKDIDINNKNNEGFTALHAASRQGHTNIEVNLL